MFVVMVLGVIIVILIYVLCDVGMSLLIIVLGVLVFYGWCWLE